MTGPIPASAVVGAGTGTGVVGAGVGVGVGVGAMGATRSAALLSRLAAEPEGYAECYPGLREMDDAIDDSDDEVDYTKMDAGNKKGPIGDVYTIHLKHITFIMSV